MFVVNDDLSIYVTRGDMVFLKVTAQKNGKPYTFDVGEVVRIKVFAKKNCEDVVLQKDFPVTKVTQGVEIILDGNDTKFGGVISKPVDYWYEVELNPYDNPQTIIGYDGEGTRVFRLYPEGKDIPPIEPDPEVIKVIDTELDLTSERPVQNQVIAREFANLQGGYQAVYDAVSKLHVTPQMFGAIGDGEADDTRAIQNAIDSSESVYIPSGTYKVSFKDNIGDMYNPAIIVPSNRHIRMASDAKIICNGVSLKRYSIFKIVDVENVTIEGGEIVGERTKHKGVEGEWGMGIYLLYARNINIKNMTIRNCWGDGICIGTIDNDPERICRNITIDNVICDNNRRQGISVCGIDGFHLTNSKLMNTKGTAPEAGIDFEPNYSNILLKNIFVSNLYTFNNTGGGVLIVNNNPCEITITDWIDEHGTKAGDSCACSLNYVGNETIRGGYVNINNFVSKYNHSAVCRIVGVNAKSTPLIINGLTVIEPHVLYAPNATTRIIYVYGSTEYSVGGFSVKGLRVMRSATTGQEGDMHYTEHQLMNVYNGNVENVYIEVDKLERTLKRCPADKNHHIVIVDNNDQMVYDDSIFPFTTKDELPKKFVRPIESGGPATYTITNNIPYGYELEIENKSNYVLNVKFEVPLKGYITNVSKEYIQIPSVYGAKIKIRRANESAYYVSESNTAISVIKS